MCWGAVQGSWISVDQLLENGHPTWPSHLKLPSQSFAPTPSILSNRSKKIRWMEGVQCQVSGAVETQKHSSICNAKKIARFKAGKKPCHFLSHFCSVSCGSYKLSRILSRCNGDSGWWQFINFLDNKAHIAYLFFEPALISVFCSMCLYLKSE